MNATWKVFTFASEQAAGDAALQLLTAGPSLLVLTRRGDTLYADSVGDMLDARAILRAAGLLPRLPARPSPARREP